MANDSTILAYLIPKLTNQVENAATDALGYILNGSAASMYALNCILQEGGFKMLPIVEVATQVTLEDGLRPDMAGYDEKGVNRLLVESKFWAPLLSGQASGYLRQLDAPGQSALLFIAPAIRLKNLWEEIRRQIGEENLSEAPPTNGLRSAIVDGASQRLILVSWDRLLDDMADRADKGGERVVVADIRQLRGLAGQQDDVAFLPIRAEDLSPDVARRITSYVRLVNDAVVNGVSQEWMSTKGMNVTPQQYGYGRYFRFVGVPRYYSGGFWFGINFDRWAASGDTPLWLRPYRNYDWRPVHLKRDVERAEVLDDMATQLKEIAKDFGADLPGE